MRRYRLFRIGAAVLALGACSTEEIGLHPLTYVTDTPASPDDGAFIVAFARTETTPGEETSPLPIVASVFLDGRQLVRADLDGPRAYTVGEGEIAGIGYLPGGAHHFAIVRVDGEATTLFAGDAEIAAGWDTRLYLFGPAGAIQGRFVSYRSQTARGTLHVSAINLVRGGPGIEVLRCRDAETCVSLAPPLATGETFDADFPAGTVEDGHDAFATGARVGYRQVPTAAWPTPPVRLVGATSPLVPSLTLVDGLPPANVVVAPVLMSESGEVREYFP